jgi:tellurite resistance protein
VSTAATPAEHAPASRLARLPVTLFASVMGLAGLALAWQRAAATIAAPGAVGTAILLAASVLYLMLLIVYAAKIARERAAVVAEWRHPVRSSLFATISIGLILLATAWLPALPALAHALWLAGAALHLLIMVLIVGTWIDRTDLEWAHANPAWFIPAVGNVLVPLAGVRLGHAELSWFFFAIGMGFWLVLLPIVFARLLFAPPLPERMRPMLFVLIPPPAIGFLSYLALGQPLDAIARVLYGLAAFFTLFLLVRAMWFVRLPFYLSWWAASFPLAAITAATLALGERTGLGAYRGLGTALLVLATLVIAWLVVRTLVALVRDEPAVFE